MLCYLCEHVISLRFQSLFPKTDINNMNTVHVAACNPLKLTSTKKTTFIAGTINTKKAEE